MSYEMITDELLNEFDARELYEEMQVVPFDSPTEIIPGLFIGSIVDLYYPKLEKLGITHFINACYDPRQDFSQLHFYKKIIVLERDYPRDIIKQTVTNNSGNNGTVMCFQVLDSLDANISQFFNYTNEFIDDALQNKKRVLVHCSAGVSRSPTIVAAYLMHHYKRTASDALRLIKDRRPIIQPNFNFIKQLLALPYEQDEGYVLNIV